jgi:hypothetical protein
MPSHVCSTLGFHTASAPGPPALSVRRRTSKGVAAPSAGEIERRHGETIPIRPGTAAPVGIQLKGVAPAAEQRGHARGKDAGTETRRKCAAALHRNTADRTRAAERAGDGRECGRVHRAIHAQFRVGGDAHCARSVHRTDDRERARHSRSWYRCRRWYQ